MALALVAAAPVSAQTAAASERERIGQMTPEQREQLFRKQQRFETLAPSEREQLRKFHRQLREQPDREQLQGVMDRYHAWLATLSPLERQKLEQLPTRERLSAVEALRRPQLNEQRRYRLPPEDREKIVGFLRRRIDSGDWYESSWLEQWDKRKRLPDVLAQQLPGQEPPERPRSEGPRGEGPRGDRPRGEGPRGEGRGGEGPRRPRRPDDGFFKDMDALFQDLSPETRAQLEGLTPRQKMDVVRGWMWQGMRSMAPSEAELERFFSEELTDERRERLLELPPEEMLHELRRLYVQKQRPQRGGGEFRDGPPRNDGPRWRRGDGLDGNGPPPPGNGREGPPPRPTGP